MPSPQGRFLVLAAALALSGCSYGNNLLDWATGSSPPPPAATASSESRPASTIATPSAASVRRSPHTSTPPRRTTSHTTSHTAANVVGNQPLVVIRFARPNVAYQHPLYTAISRALERKPNATFTITAVAPNADTPAQIAINTNASRQNTEKVLRALTNMGLPANRLSLSATTSPDIQTNEVRIFVH